MYVSRNRLRGVDIGKDDWIQGGKAAWKGTGHQVGESDETIGWNRSVDLRDLIYEESEEGCVRAWL
jgi:hypothetical protein